MEKLKNKFDLKTIFISLNIALILATILADICYMANQLIPIDALALKGMASAMFVLLGVVNFVYIVVTKNTKIIFPIIMLVGLIFAMLGDIILNIEFIVGAILFAVGHVFYFIAYCFKLKFEWKDLIYGVAIFIPSLLFITIVPIFNFGGALMEIVCVLYALIISIMVGKAVANFIREKNLTNILILIGSILFFFSDLMLLLNVFGSLPKFVDLLCLGTYYPAECLLAFAIFTYKGEDKKESLQQENNDKIEV